MMPDSSYHVWNVHGADGPFLPAPKLRLHALLPEMIAVVGSLPKDSTYDAQSCLGAYKKQAEVNEGRPIYVNADNDRYMWYQSGWRLGPSLFKKKRGSRKSPREGQEGRQRIPGTSSKPPLALRG